jgi:hypothetical protein
MLWSSTALSPEFATGGEMPTLSRYVSALEITPG